MRPDEFDATMTLFNYYFDEAVEAIPRMADEYNENSILETIRKFATNYEYCWFNAYSGQRPVGFVAGYMSSCPWNDQLISANIAFVYLLEGHRNLDNFRELYKEFEQWARLINAYEITAGDIGIELDRSRTLYEHFGFEPMLLMRRGVDK
jgi:GNAT superfamily N-acetyltransferase